MAARHPVVVLACGLVPALLAACARPSSGNASPSLDAAPSASAASRGGPALVPPPDAARSCTAMLTGRFVPSPPTNEPGIEFKVKNTGTLGWRYCKINVFGYDPSGARVSSAIHQDNVPLKPGGEETLSVPLYDERHEDAGVPGSAFEILTTEVTFDDGSEWEDPTFSYQAHVKPTAPVTTIARPALPAKGGAGGKAK